MADALRANDSAWGEEIPAIPRRGTQVHPEIYFVESSERRLRARYSNLRRREQLERLRGFLLLAAGSVLAALLVGALVASHARLMSLSHNNAAMEREIQRLETLTRQKQVELVERIDVTAIEARARELGLDYPRQAQQIYIQIPGADGLVLRDAEMSAQTARAAAEATARSQTAESMAAANADGR
ncbi:MAG: hypothetical protein QM296_04080 [Bacillota bacterium]|nr:hypothetical protein [Bacillota bacterium]